MKQIIATSAAIFITFTAIIGQSANKPIKNSNCDGIVKIQNKSQDTLKASAEYDVIIKAPSAYKYNFTVSVSGAKIRAANGQYKLTTSASNKASITITSANGRTLICKKDYMLTK